MSEPVSIRLEQLELPTYQPGPDSPYPSYGWMGRAELYPYTTKMDITGEAVPMHHRAVVLENRYIRATILPDIGGRVFSLFDKVAGKEAFMTPPSLHYQNIAMRGSWLAGGIEFNSGFHHHTANTVSPVAWAMRPEADGSAAVWIGSLTMPLEYRWSVRIGLRPDSAALDLEIHACGPEALPGLLYWWTNAGVEVTRDSRFFYFGKRGYIGGVIHGWPICDGLDYSWYRNRYVAGDMFLMDCQTDAMAFYDYGRQHGVANIADRFDAPGQKYFTWGNHDLGRLWDHLFSDTGQTYCELQRGRHVSQGTNDAIAPMTEECWRESWIPLAGTEGFSAHENDLILSVVQSDDNPSPSGRGPRTGGEGGSSTPLPLGEVGRRPGEGSSAGGPHPTLSHRERGEAGEGPHPTLSQRERGEEAKLHLVGVRPAEKLAVEAFASGKSVGQWAVARVAPDARFTQAVALPAGGRLDRVVIKDAAGKTVMDWRELPVINDDTTTHLGGSHCQPLPANPETADSLFAQAQWQRFNNWPRPNDEAVRMYQRVLAMDPGHAATHQALAEICMYEARYDAAAGHIRKAMLRRPFDGDLFALLGWALLRAGKAAEAVDAFANAARPEPSRRRGLVGLANAHLSAGNLAAAGAAVERLLADNPRDKWGRLVQVIVLRRSGDKAQATTVLKDLLAQDPVWSRLHAEAMLLGVPANLTDGTRQIGDDSISAATHYIELGLYDDARTILAADEANEPVSPAVKLAHLAYVEHKLGNEAAAKAALAELAKAPVEMAYPWTTAAIGILQELILYRDKSIQDAKSAVTSALQAAMESAIRKTHGGAKSVKVSIDRLTGDVTATVDGGSIDMRELGRIAAQSAKQEMIQRIREVEKGTGPAEITGDSELAMLHLMLGNILPSRNRLEEAAAAWAKAAELGLQSPILSRNLGAFAHHHGQKDDALACYRRAWDLAGIATASPEKARRELNLYAEFDRFLAAQGRHAERLEVYDKLPEPLKSRSMVAHRRVLQLLDSARWEEAYRECMARTFFRGEHEFGARHNYVEAVLGMALPAFEAGRFDEAEKTLRLALEYPRNLNVGRHGTVPGESPIYYLLGIAAEAAGQADAARQHWQAAAGELHWPGMLAQAYEMLAWLALGQRGRGHLDDADELEQTGLGGTHPAGQWAPPLNRGLVQIAKGHIDAARAIWEKALAESPDCRMLRLHLAFPRSLLEKMIRIPVY